MSASVPLSKNVNIALQYRPRRAWVPPAPHRSATHTLETHTGSREKGADHGKKDAGEGGAQAETGEPGAQRNRRRC